MEPVISSDVKLMPLTFGPDLREQLGVGLLEVVEKFTHVCNRVGYSENRFRSCHR